MHLLQRRTAGTTVPPPGRQPAAAPRARDRGHATAPGRAATVPGMNSTNPHDPDDGASARLAAWLAAGDADAFRALHRATHQRLLLIAMEVLPQRERAEDALQEAYLKAWRHAAKFDPALSRPMTWLMRIVRNTAIDHWRARQHEQQHLVPEPDDAAEVVADTADTPEQICIRRQLRRQVERVMPALPRAERHALALVMLQGCTPAEAARASGLPGDQGRLPLRRALTALRRQLAAGATALAA